MNLNKCVSYLSHPFQSGVLALLVFAAPLARAGTVWTGPVITFSQTGRFLATTAVSNQMTNVDQITADVWLTRPYQTPMVNAAPAYQRLGKAVPYSITGASPSNTMWALGTLANTNLAYQTWAQLIGGELGTGDLSKTLPSNQFVVHLVSDDIFLSVEFTSWAYQGGTFTYKRSTPALAAPTVNITSPAGGAVFAAPANVPITASASVSSGTVTNVAFFASTSTSTNSLGSAQSSPFGVTASNMAAGSYSLIAVATAAGISATSPVVNITVVSPVPVAISGPAVSGGQFSFDYTVNPGLTYVIKSSSNLVNWVSMATNVASNNPAIFTDNSGLSTQRFYQVVLQPNP